MYNLLDLNDQQVKLQMICKYNIILFYMHNENNNKFSITVISPEDIFYHGNKKLKDGEQLHGNPVFVTEVPLIAHNYCKDYTKISLWRPNRKLRLLNLNTKNIKELLLDIPENDKINIKIADPIFEKFATTQKNKKQYLSNYIPAGTKYKVSARDVIKTMPWKNLMRYSDKWKGMSYYGRAFGMYQPPPLFLGANGLLRRSSVYQADAILFHYLVKFLKKKYNIDGIYSNAKKYNLKPGGFQGKTVENELILHNTDIVRDKHAEKQFLQNYKHICKLLKPILNGQIVNKPKYNKASIKVI